MASEIEAAAERKRRHQAMRVATNEWVDYCSGGGDSQETRDNATLADAYLARLAADRAEREERARPIDEAWMKSIGCKKMAINRWKTQEQIRVNVWLVECVRWMVKIDGWLVQMQTRGQLLDLLRVLKGGVE